jgi:hypothetical protein
MSFVGIENLGRKTEPAAAPGGAGSALGSALVALFGRGPVVCAPSCSGGAVALVTACHGIYRHDMDSELGRGTKTIRNALCPG